jgi:hypothetical protein
MALRRFKHRRVYTDESKRRGGGAIWLSRNLADVADHVELSRCVEVRYGRAREFGLLEKLRRHLVLYEIEARQVDSWQGTVFLSV